MGTPTKQMLDLGDFLSDGEDEEIRDMNRRGSNVSLTRFRSCPQLLDEDTHIPSQTFENVVDDTANIGKPLIQRSVSPAVLRRFQMEQSFTPGSTTPTPPSTPRSRRSVYSQKESPSTPIQALSPSSTPRMLHGHFPHMSLISLGSNESSDSLIDSNMSSKVPLNLENLQRHELMINTSVDVESAKSENDAYNAALHSGLSVDPRSSDLNVRLQQLKHHHHHQQTDEELQNKCKMWLQTLNITQSDKIKSKSHIQLPPI